MTGDPGMHEIISIVCSWHIAADLRAAEFWSGSGGSSDVEGTKEADNPQRPVRAENASASHFRGRPA